MSSTNNNKIQFCRSQKPCESLGDAIEKLNTLQHIPGQPVISYYNLNGKINCVFAIGIKEGSGKDSYSIISTEDKIIVDEVKLDDLEDISRVATSQKTGLFLCKVSKENKLYWVSSKLKDDGNIERVLTEVSNDIPIQIKDISTGIYWWISKDELKKVSDFPTKEEFNNLFMLTQGLKQTNENLISPTIEKHKEEIDILMEKSYPVQIKFFRDIEEKDEDGEVTIIKTVPVDDVEVYEKGIIRNISIKAFLENKSKDITSECTWEVKRKSSGENIEEEGSIDPNKIILYNCSETDSFIFKADHPDLGKIEKEYKTIFTLKTIVGKIKFPELEKIKPEEYYTIGKGLPLNEETFDIKTIINSIPENEKERIIRGDYEEYTYSGNFNINEYLFVAIPETHKLFSDIIDNTTGLSIIDDFEIFGSEIELFRDEKGNSEKYNLYLRKQGIHSREKKFSITFKP